MSKLHHRWPVPTFEDFYKPAALVEPRQVGPRAAQCRRRYARWPPLVRGLPGAARRERGTPVRKMTAAQHDITVGPSPPDRLNLRIGAADSA